MESFCFTRVGNSKDEAMGNVCGYREHNGKMATKMQYGDDARLKKEEKA